MNGPIEPDAEKRRAAYELRQMYLALRQEGFTRSEALTVIGHILAGIRGDQS